MGSVVLSPHLDDAVLSCWHVLTQPGEVAVVNVFAGSPNGRSPAGWWDRLTHATTSAARMNERHAEDAAALQVSGRTAVNLDFLDAQFGAPAQSAEAIARRIAAEIDPRALVYAPASIGEVPDHALVRSAALALRRVGFEVALYADLPHAISFGWPASVTGAPEHAEVDPAAFWELALRQAAPSPDELTPEVHTLDAESLERKLAAVRTYRTQLPALVALNPRLADLTTLRHEVVWRWT